MHTPRPWKQEAVEYKRGEDAYYEVRGPKGELICQTIVREISTESSALKEDDFNTRLIAAAPDLLEALAMVRDADEDCKRDGLPIMPSIPRATIDAVLAQAGWGGSEA
jgi:hypothetical protein